MGGAHIQAVPIEVAPATPASKTQPAVAETFEWPVPSSSFAGVLNASATLRVPPRTAPALRFHAFEKLCIEVRGGLEWKRITYGYPIMDERGSLN